MQISDRTASRCGADRSGREGNRAMTPVDRMRLDRGAVHLHALGPRATAELLAALATRTGEGLALLELLADYGRLTPGMVRAAGGNRFPVLPLHLVEQAQ